MSGMRANEVCHVPAGNVLFGCAGGNIGAECGVFGTIRRPARASALLALHYLRVACGNFYLFSDVSGFVEYQQAHEPAQHDEGLILARIQMPMRGDVGVGLHGVEQAVRGGIVARMQVVVFAPAWAGGGLCT